MKNKSILSCSLILLKSSKIFIPILLLTYVVYAYFTTTPPNYCKAQERIISTEEICSKLFDDTINAGFLQLDDIKTTGRDHYINHIKNCVIDRSSAKNFRLGGVFKVFDDDRVEVFLKYKMTKKAQEYYGVSSPKELNEWILMTPCGEIVEKYSE